MTVRAATDDPSAKEVVEVTNPSGAGQFLVVCEHASRFIPAEFGDLGLDDAALNSHIAWDPGALAVSEAMASMLDAPLVAQRVSRLLYDCNRPPESESAVPAVSEIYRVPGNASLSAADRQARVDRFYVPFRDTLAACVNRRVETGRAPAIVTVHSFTPVYMGVRRETGLGILHDTDARLADALLETTKAGTDLAVHRNRPYGPEDGVTHTLAEHGVARGLLNVMLEIRNDLIGDSASQAAMAEWLSRCLAEALAVLTVRSGGREIA
ncbi:MAG: N-formylglutamate amidohydrolase [Thermohalobaculum sp.]